MEGTRLEKKAAWFRVLFPAVYLVSYLTRYSYATALLRIIAEMQTTKAAASLAVTGAFISYGAGQLLSGWLGDRVQPHRLVLLGLLGTAGCNLAVALSPSIGWMNGIWVVNGLFQAFLWPPLVRLTSEAFAGDRYRRTITAITQAGIAGQVLVIVLTALLVRTMSFRAVFCTVAVIAGGFAILWAGSTRGLRFSVLSSEGKSAPPPLRFGVLVRAGMLAVFVGALAVGALRDGISTWMPAYIGENFALSDSLSILTGIVLPLLGIVGISLASGVIRRFSNELYPVLLLFALASVLSALLLAVFAKWVGVDILLLALVSTCAHGVNLIFTGIVPGRFSRFGQVSTVSGILNATVYIGSALSAYGIAVLADRFGWQASVCSWLIACVVSLICLALGLRAYVGFCKEYQ